MPTFVDINGQRPFSRAAEAQPDRVTMRLLVIEDDRDAADYFVRSGMSPIRLRMATTASPWRLTVSTMS
jgi:hypothetical protein